MNTEYKYTGKTKAVAEASLNIRGTAAIRSKIESMAPGTVFSPSSFLDYDDRNLVGVALKRFKDEGFIRNVGRGLYDKPKHSKALKKAVAPSEDAIITALAEKTGHRYKHTGAYAANMLGLSTQVPAKTSLLTDGITKSFTVGGRIVSVKHSSVKRMSSKGKPGLLIEAMYFLGKDFSIKNIAKAKQHFLSQDKQDLQEQLKFAPAWMHKFLREVLKP